jgi:succinylarginine dihydrolase
MGRKQALGCWRNEWRYDPLRDRFRRVDYLFFRLRSILDAIDRRVDRWWRDSLPEDEVIDPVTRQMAREAMEKLADGDWGGE